MKKIAVIFLILCVSSVPGWTQFEFKEPPPHPAPDIHPEASPPETDPPDGPPPPEFNRAMDELLELIAAGLLEEAQNLARELRESRGLPGPDRRAWLYDPEEREALEFLRRELPREYKELTERMEREPAERPHHLRELVERYRHAMELRREDPEAFEREIGIRRMEGEAWELGGRIKKSKNEEERKTLEQQLRKILNNIFDIRQDQRKQEMESLRRELENLERLFQRLNENREKAIEKKFKEMTGETDELDFM